MKCPYCGAEVSGNYCAYCGSEVRTESAGNNKDDKDSDKKKGFKSRIAKILIGIVCVVAVLAGIGMLSRDQTPPVVNVIEQTVSYGSKLSVDDLATGEDDRSDTVALKITDVSSSKARINNGGAEISFPEIGKYEITISGTDEKNNISSAVVLVDVIDDVPPEIEGISKSFTLSESDTELGVSDSVSALDEIDGDITDQISVDTSKIKFGEVGEYAVVYSVSDKAGNVARKSVPVIVKDSTPPELQIKEDSIELTAGDSAPSLKSNVSAIDSEDGNLNSRIKVDDGYSGAAEPPFRCSEYRESGTAYRQIYSYFCEFTRLMTGPNRIPPASICYSLDRAARC